MTDDLPLNLIVAVTDDDESVRESLGSLLGDAGYSVCLFDSAAALLASRGLSDIDCLISDIDMPGIDGYELSRLASTARPELPVILMTGHHELADRSPQPRSRQPQIFKKPFDAQELLAAVRFGLQRNLPKKELQSRQAAKPVSRTLKSRSR